MNRFVLLGLIFWLVACPWCKAQSQTEGCEIEISIIEEFPPERCDDERGEGVSLNGKDAQGNLFAPGKYLLVINRPGFWPLQEEIVIPVGQKVLRIERTLRAKPRQLKIKITHDVPPPANLPPYQINLSRLDDPQKVWSVREGGELQPGLYLLKINQEAYEPIKKEWFVWPAEDPFVIEKELVAKEVTIKLNIIYDIEPPPQDLPAFLLIIDSKTKIPTEGWRVKPGRHYELDVLQPGYSFGTRKEIDILPSEQPYEISAKGVVKPRPISFDIQNGCVNPFQATNGVTGKDITFQDKFRPGEEVDCIVKFKKFQTVRTRVRVTPGEGPFVVNCPLKRLVRSEFRSRQNSLELDKIIYPYVLYADSQPIELHLTEIERGPGGRCFYTVMTDLEAKNLVVYAGYLFAQIGFSKTAVSDIPPLDNIHIPKLIDHLGQVAHRQERGHAAALDALAELLKDPARHAKFQAAPKAEIAPLLEYVRSWKLADPQDQARHKTVIEVLEGLGK